MSELSPCPFCGGGTTLIKENGRVWGGQGYGEPSSVSVQHWCEPVQGQPSRMLERVGRDRESAIAAWNRRATPSAVDAAPAAPSELHYLIDKAIIAARRDQRDLTPESMAAAAEARNTAIAAARSPSPALTAADAGEAQRLLTRAKRMARVLEANELVPTDRVIGFLYDVAAILTARSTQAVVPAPAADERERFEAWAGPKGCDLAWNFERGFLHPMTREFYAVWQARAALASREQQEGKQ